jgi:hypothetical protein
MTLHFQKNCAHFFAWTLNLQTVNARAHREGAQTHVYSNSSPNDALMRRLTLTTFLLMTFKNFAPHKNAVVRPQMTSRIF